jgi:hypothetical protein
LPGQPPQSVAGNTTVHRGRAVPVSPAISIVVMAIHADARVADAIASLGDPTSIEIIVVNTGTGSLRPLLASLLDRIVLVESPALRLAGGTRNLGLAEARGPVVAFLAADCLAAPGWVDHRLTLHRTEQAVASAILPAPAPNGRVTLPSWAAHMLLYCRRDPDYPAPHTVRYGVSYRREVFAEHGTFLEDRATGEDTEFNERLPAEPAWDPAIVTLHRNPMTVHAALADAFRRGVRLHGWMRTQTSRPTLRALRRVSGALTYAMSLCIRLPARRLGTLLAATPLVWCLALAQMAGALSQAGRSRGA